MSSTVLRRFNGILVLVVMAAVASNPVWAQEVARPNFALIRKTEFANLDRQNVQRWLDQQIDAVVDAPSTEAAAKLAQDIFFGRDKGKEGIVPQYQAQDATEGFKTGMAQILCDTFQNRYKLLSDNPTDQKRLASIYLLMALNQVGRPMALPCYRLAIQDQASGIRTLAAEGLLKIRAQVPAADWTPLVPMIQKAAVAENNRVALSRLYQLLIVPEGGRGENAAVVQSVLEARAERFEQTGLLPTTADADAVAWLAGQVKGANAQTKNAAVATIARVLADAVYSYTQSKPTEKQKEMLERTIMQVEKSLTELTAVAKAPNVTAAMLAAGASQADKMGQQLDAWIGTATTPGVLNEAPFNLPRGLNIKRSQPDATATAPA